jgi:hypothetical protein
MTSGRPTIKQQCALFARKDGRMHLVQWTEYAVDDERRTEVWVWRVVRILVPSTRIGARVSDRDSAISRAALPGWLRERGFEIVAEMSAPDGDEVCALW